MKKKKTELRSGALESDSTTRAKIIFHYVACNMTVCEMKNQLESWAHNTRSLSLERA